MTFKRKIPEGNVHRAVSHGLNQPGQIINKNGRQVQHEINDVHWLILRLDRDRKVEDYMSFPEIFHYIDANGRRKPFKPPLKVWIVDGTVQIHALESGPGATTGIDAPSRRDAAMSEICRSRGWEYVVHRRADLPKETEVANLLALLYYRPTAYADTLVAEQAQLCLSARRHVVLHQLITDIALLTGTSAVAVQHTLCHMLWHGHLETDLQKRILKDARPSSTCLVWLPTDHSQERNYSR
jgi:hypothetical protein